MIYKGKYEGESSQNMLEPGRAFKSLGPDPIDPKPRLPTSSRLAGSEEVVFQKKGTEQAVSTTAAGWAV
jgi:hypothetical protein